MQSRIVQILKSSVILIIFKNIFCSLTELEIRDPVATTWVVKFLYFLLNACCWFHSNLSRMIDAWNWIWIPSGKSYANQQSAIFTFEQTARALISRPPVCVLFCYLFISPRNGNCFWTSQQHSLDTNTTHIHFWPLLDIQIYFIFGALLFRFMFSIHIFLLLTKMEKNRKWTRPELVWNALYLVHRTQISHRIIHACM